jgi:hypothetical protein
MGTWLSHPGSDYHEENANQLRRLFNDFGITQVTLASDLSDLLRADIDLTRMKKYLGDEDVMLSIVNARQFMPVVRQPAPDPSRLMTDIRAILDGTAPADVVEARVRELTTVVHDHGNAIALSLARAEARTRTDDALEKRGIKHVLKNLRDFTNDPYTVRLQESASLELDPKSATIKRALVSNGPSQLMDLYDATLDSGNFLDATALQMALDILRDRGYVYLDRKRRYVWIGS